MIGTSHGMAHTNCVYRGVQLYLPSAPSAPSAAGYIAGYTAQVVRFSARVWYDCTLFFLHAVIHAQGFADQRRNLRCGSSYFPDKLRDSNLPQHGQILRGIALIFLMRLEEAHAPNFILHLFTPSHPSDAQGQQQVLQQASLA